jgi:hypothetical protein
MRKLPVPIGATRDIPRERRLRRTMRRWGFQLHRRFRVEKAYWWINYALKIDAEDFLPLRRWSDLDGEPAVWV